MSITAKRIIIRDYRGIKELDTAIGTSGAVATGECGRGKTSFLNAFRAALDGRDVGSDAIRHGEDKAEIFVDLGEITAKRKISQSGQTLQVRKGEFEAKKPQTMLAELVGTVLDPLDLLTLNAKQRRKKVLEALPITVDVETMRQWWLKCPDDYDCSGHGLEVVERTREKFYAMRTEANKALKDAKATADRAREAEQKAIADAPQDAPDVASLESAHAKAKAVVAELVVRGNESRWAEERTSETRRKITELRSQAEGIQFPSGDLEAELRAAIAARDSAYQKVEEARKVFDAAKIALDAAMVDEGNRQEQLDTVRENQRFAEQSRQKQSQLLEQASTLESAVSAASVQAPTKEEVEKACQDEKAAFEALSAGKTDESKLRTLELAVAARNAAVAAQEQAESKHRALDDLVKKLTDDAPKKLLDACDGIQGLTLVGDDIRLDGVSLDSLCGREKIRFAVQIAKRSARAKILIVDGLERLDPKSYAEFVREATSDGWQLIASRVSEGEMQIEALSVEESAVESAAE